MQLLEDKNGSVNLISSISENNKIKTYETSIINPHWVDFEFNKYNKQSIIDLRVEKTESLKEFDSISFKSSNIIFNQFNYPSQNNLLYKNFSLNEYQIITNLKSGTLLISNKSNKVINLLQNIQTTRAFIDNENNIWIGTIGEGVFFFSGLIITGKKFETFKSNDIHSISLNDNEIIIGTEEGKVLSLNKKTLKNLKSYNIDKGNTRIRKLFKYKQDFYVLSDLCFSKIAPKENFIKLKNIYEPDFQNLNLANFKALDIYNNYAYTANAHGVSKINLDTKEVQKI